MKKFQKLVVLDKVKMTKEQEKEIKSLAKEVAIYNDTAKNKAEVIKRIGDADAIITSWTDLDKKIFDACPNLKYLGIWATGYGWIDVKYANEKCMTVTNVPGYATESVAELVFGQLISLLRKTREADERVRQGKFEQEGLEGQELRGKTIGIIGFGRIGTRVAELAKAFGMNVIYFSRTRKPDCEKNGVKWCTLDELVKKADIITLHASSGEELLSEKELDEMKDGAIVINFGIAGAVNEDALIKRVKNGKLYAIMDHYVGHKIKPGFIEQTSRTLLTPEIGFYTTQALSRLTQICIENAKSYLAGKVQNRVVS